MCPCRELLRIRNFRVSKNDKKNEKFRLNESSNELQEQFKQN